jgi:hypothetical protein
MKNMNEILRAWLVMNVIFILVYEYAVIVHLPKMQTISEALRQLVDDYPALLVLIGTIGGHLFWRK